MLVKGGQIPKEFVKHAYVSSTAKRPRSSASNVSSEGRVPAVKKPRASTGNAIFPPMRVLESTTYVMAESNFHPIQTISVLNPRTSTVYDFRFTVGESGIPGGGGGAFVQLLRVRELIKGFIPRIPEKRQAFVPNLSYPITVKIAVPPPSDKPEFRLKVDGSFYSDTTGNSYVPISRYAPFRPSDHKPHYIFAIKEYLWAGYPTEWDFNSPVDMVAYADQYQPNKTYTEQTYDITDDTTGEPHLEASSDIPKFVNEVGHSPNLVQNVFSNPEDALLEDDPNINYLFHWSQNNQSKPLGIGDKVELLTNYGEDYEEIRLKKGYGVKTESGGIEAIYRRAAEAREAMAHNIFSYTAYER